MIALIDVGEIIMKLFLLIDGVVYNFIGICYKIFLLIATTNLFSETSYQEIVSRIYIVLGVVMLFVLTYSLLKAIINPDEVGKDNNSGFKIIINTITSLVLIVIMPVIFTYIIGFQTAILKSNMFGNIILGTNTSIAKDSNLQSSGANFSYLVFNPFFRPSDDFCKEKLNLSQSDYQNSDYLTIMNNCAEEIDAKYNEKTITLGEADKIAAGVALDSTTNEKIESNLGVYRAFAQNAADGEINYMFIISTIAGVFLCYVMISFCFDLGIRAVRLAFLQIIAPIPIIARIMPGTAKDIFSNWVKKTIATVVEVFIRVIIMFLGIFLITMLSDSLNNLIKNEGFLGLIAQAFIIMGIIAFIKEAPKLLGEIFPGLDSGKMSLGITEKLRAGGALAAGGAIGAGVSSLARNITQDARDINKTWREKSLRGKAGAVGGSVVRAFRGTTGGLIRGGKAGVGAKNIAEMRGAAHTGVEETMAARSAREAYMAAHGGTMIGVAKGRIEDTVDSVKKWAGYDNIDDLKAANKTIDTITNQKKVLGDAAENLIVGEANKNKEKNFGIDSRVQFSDQSNLGKQYSNFNTLKIRELRQKMEEAKVNGFASDQYGVNVSLAEWEDLYGNYLYEFKNAVQNQALKSATNYSNLALATKADLSEVRNAAEDYRNTIGRNLNADYILESNAEAFSKGGLEINATTIKGDLDVTGESALSKLGDQMKIAQSRNYAEISKIVEKEKTKEGQ